MKLDNEVCEPFIGADGTDYEGLSAHIIRNDNERYPYRVEFYDNGEEIEAFKRFCSNMWNAMSVAKEFTTGNGRII
jgi:hypothetical protein